MQSLLESVLSKFDKLKSLATPEAIKFVEEHLKENNRKISNEIGALKKAIAEKEISIGVKQPMFCTSASTIVASSDVPAMQPADSKPPVVLVEEKNKAAISSKEVSQKKTNSKAVVPDTAVDIGRLDMRVGRICEVSLHPDADSLYVEKVDLGNNDIRTVVSGLVKFVPIEELQNRVGIFLCNLKPAKMRGVESQAMLMCASAPEAGGVEPLIVEGAGIKLGDSVVVPGYNHNPDEQLNPKKKIFEQIKPDLRVTAEGLAGYKNVPWQLKNAPQAVIKASKLRDVQIA